MLDNELNLVAVRHVARLLEVPVIICWTTQLVALGLLEDVPVHCHGGTEGHHRQVDHLGRAVEL